MKQTIRIGFPNTLSFCEGMPVTTASAKAVVFKGERGRVQQIASTVWRRLTWWRQSRQEVIAIDHVRGEIDVATMRWSWRRWRWVTA